MAATVGRVRADIGRQAYAALAMDQDEMSLDDHATRCRFTDMPSTSATDLLRCAKIGPT